MKCFLQAKLDQIKKFRYVSAKTNQIKSNVSATHTDEQLPQYIKMIHFIVY